ncbi:hypothetical protein CVO77_03320 [Sphingopyxis lindanitolerans]|uniref:Uncharacterized protein n=1 Tax=Sphingopyxis lindanitolerans TaxID=2054227 RepID=A0A2S8B5J4_9SPHN|nr:hypothetical protein [Sphingopyxis lindanitolerans]PQM27620.1 hypothetical protein CVO77_03320 [Sphingopyxis lindanitolerans]
MDSDRQIDIRERLRAHAARQLTIARLNAPEDWQGELVSALRAQRATPSFWAPGSDLRLFLESFAIFFVATMMFLI